MQEAPEIIARKFINRTSRHLFLTGRAGTGKTTFLRGIISQTHKKAVIAAPTGVAAINAGGVTLHSLFQLPFGTFVPDDSNRLFSEMSSEINTPRTLMRNVHMQGNKRRLIQEMELLIIDEVSMLRADILDAIDRVLRSIRRKRSVPFGGVQMLFIGDLLQLPPVVKDDEWSILKNYYRSIHFFDALALKEQPPLYIELEKIYRQSDPEFIDLLNNIRDNKITREDAELLNIHYKPGFSPASGDGYIHLTTHNRIADSINQRELEKIKGKSYTFSAEINRDFKDHLFPVEQDLVLKTGAQVMFIKNDPSGNQRFFNGKIGVVTELGPDGIEVGFNDGDDPVEVEQYTWEHKRYRLNESDQSIHEEVLGQFVHYPLKLAWAVTIHKSQGLTFEKAILDVEKAFAPGQIYVALSRLVSLDGLVLSSRVPMSGFTPDSSITEFANTSPGKSDFGPVLEAESHRYMQQKILECFDFYDLEQAIGYHISTYDKDEKRSAKQRFLPRVRGIREKLLKESQVAGNFRKEIISITGKTGGYDLEQLHERIKAAIGYFEPRLKRMSDEILALIKELEDAIGVKKYIRELRELDSWFFSKIQAMRKSLAIVESVRTDDELVNGDFATPEEMDLRKEVAPKTKKSKGKTGKKKKKRQSKGESAAISYGMLKEGKSVPEIAKERDLVVSTIEGHLSTYLEKGELDILEIMDESKVSEIEKALKKNHGDTIIPVKKALGNDYSFGEIRMVLAARNKGGE